ncbi:uncharacterized protein LOC111257462 [Setaria italica]|uniref:uncharacterized protein LOC111257462 n=1 Tax=Setaria italica TaxID=4555 RepID=UPI000BE553CF|nr:uncharacterized protein LOC111257462 [Setaria italica]
MLSGYYYLVVAVAVYIALVTIEVYLREALILLLCLRYCRTTYPMLPYYNISQYVGCNIAIKPSRTIKVASVCVTKRVKSRVGVHCVQMYPPFGKCLKIMLPKEDSGVRLPIGVFGVRLPIEVFWQTKR